MAIETPSRRLSSARPRRALAVFSLLFLSSGPIQAPAAASGDFIELDSTKSTLVAITGRAGFFSFLGHDHAIIAERWTAHVRYDPSDVALSSAEVTVQTDSLVIDSAEARRTAHLGSDGPDPEDVRKLQKQFLGPDVLDAEGYPTIEFKTLSVHASGGNHLALNGRLTLHGITRDLTVPFAVEEQDGTLRFFGTLRFRQSDFGMTPASVLGVVKVKDEMEIRFNLFSAAKGPRR